MSISTYRPIDLYRPARRPRKESRSPGFPATTSRPGNPERLVIVIDDPGMNLSRRRCNCSAIDRCTCKSNASYVALFRFLCVSMAEITFCLVVRGFPRFHGPPRNPFSSELSNPPCKRSSSRNTSFLNFPFPRLTALASQRLVHRFFFRDT